MKTYLFKVFNFTAILTFLFNSFVSAQITSSVSDGRNNTKPVQAEQAEARILQVTPIQADISNKDYLIYKTIAVRRRVKILTVRSKFS